MLTKIKSLRRRSTASKSDSKKSPIALQPRISVTPPTSAGHQHSTSSRTQKEPSAVITTMNDQEREDDSRDFEIFLAQARRAEEKREEAMQRAIREADRKRRNMNLDPWTKRW